MVPSTADDTAADTEQKDGAQTDEQSTEDTTAEQSTEESSGDGQDDSSEDSSGGDEDEQSSGSGEKIGDRDDDDSHAREPVDVAPDPERTGIDVDKPPRLDELTEDEVEEIRKERLDPDNRPDNVEVDNTQRDFDTEMGRFEDSDEDPPETAPFIDPEKPDNQDDADDDQDDGETQDDADGSEQSDGGDDAQSMEKDADDKDVANDE